MQRASRMDRQWTTLASLLVATACFRATENMALTTFALLAKERVGVGSAAIGGLAAVAAGVTVAVNVGVAGRVPVSWSGLAAACGSLVVVPALVILGQARSVMELGVGAVLLGLGGGVVFPALTTAVGQVDPERRERMLALFALTLSGSLAVGPLLESALLGLSHQNVRVPFFAFTILPCVGVIAIGLAWTLSGRHHVSTAAPTPSILTEEGPVVRLEAPGSETAGPLRSLLSRGALGNRGWRMAITGELLYAVPFAAITVFGALLAKTSFGVSPEEAQLGFSCFFVTSLTARAAVVWRAPIGRKLPPLLLSGLLTALGLLLLAGGNGFVLLVLAMGILGIPHGITFPIVLAQVAEASTSVSLGSANAALLAVSNSTAVLVPAVLGGLIPATGYRGMTLLLLLPVGFFTILLWRQRPPAGRPEARAG